MSILDAAAAALAQWRGRTVGGVDLPTVMTAIAGAESDWRNDVAGDRLGHLINCNGWESWGLWQIHMPSHAAMLRRFTGADDPCRWAQWLSEPANAARAADGVIGSTAGDLPLSALVPWTVWWSIDGGKSDAGDGHGSYKYRMAQARAAIEALSTPPGGENGGGTDDNNTVPEPILVIESPFPALLSPSMLAAGVAAAGVVILGALALRGQDHSGR